MHSICFTLAKKDCKLAANENEMAALSCW